MNRRKNISNGQYIADCVEAAGWEVFYKNSGDFPYSLEKCVNPECSSNQKNEKGKCSITENGIANCFQKKCFVKGTRYDDVVELLKLQGVKIENLTFGAPQAPEQTREITKKIYLDIINSDEEHSVAFREMLINRNLDPVSFVSKYPPVMLEILVHKKTKDGVRDYPFITNNFFMWEMYDGSYCGRARYGEEYFKEKGLPYQKYYKMINEGALATPGIVDVVNKQPDILYIVEGYFDFFPFPPGTCLPITAQKIIEHDMEEAGRRVSVKKVIYLPDSDVPPNVKLNNVNLLEKVFRYANVELRRIADLFPEVKTPKDMGDIFASMPKADIFARLGLY